MTRTTEGAGRRPLPSPVACPGSPGAQPTGNSAAPQEPIPGLLAYLTEAYTMYTNLAQTCATRAADKRASAHTRRQYTQSQLAHTAKARELAGFIEAYHLLSEKSA